MYCSVAELAQQYGVREIAQLLEDEEAESIDSALLNAILTSSDTSSWSQDQISRTARGVSRAESIIQRCERIIDASAGKHYPVPLSDDQARTTAVHSCCQALARAMLADDGDNLSEQMSKDRERWMIWLRDLASQKVILPGISPIAANSGQRAQRLTAKPRSLTDRYMPE